MRLEAVVRAVALAFVLAPSVQTPPIHYNVGSAVFRADDCSGTTLVHIAPPPYRLEGVAGDGNGNFWVALDCHGACGGGAEGRLLRNGLDVITFADVGVSDVDVACDGSVLFAAGDAVFRVEPSGAVVGELVAPADCLGAGKCAIRGVGAGPNGDVYVALDCPACEQGRLYRNGALLCSLPRPIEDVDVACDGTVYVVDGSGAYRLKQPCADSCLSCASLLFLFGVPGCEVTGVAGVSDGTFYAAVDCDAFGGIVTSAGVLLASASAGVTDVDHAAAAGPSVCPTSPPGGPCPARSLVGAPAAISLSAGGVHTLTLDAGTCNAGLVYVVFGSTGTSGIPIDDVFLPLTTPDPFGYMLTMLVSANTPAFADTVGFFDAAGRATARITVPPGIAPHLAGSTLFHAYLAADPVAKNVVLASAAAPMTLVP